MMIVQYQKTHILVLLQWKVLWLMYLHLWMIPSLFITTPCMIDLIFKMGLQKYSSASYGGPPSNSKFASHAARDCVVPFMPVFTHSQAFQRAENFGYYYIDLHVDAIVDSTTTSTTTGSNAISMWVPLIVTGFMLSLITILAWYVTSSIFIF